MIPKGIDSSVTAKIIHEQDKENPLQYSFHLADTVIKTGEITKYQWFVDNSSDSSLESAEEIYTHTFLDYGDVKVKVLLTDSAGNVTEIVDAFSILRPLKFTQGSATESLLKVHDISGKSLIDGTYSRSLHAYYITDIAIPTNIEFDATDVKVENRGYELTKVEWDLDENGIFEKTGMTFKYEVVEEKRYTFEVRYTFTDTDKNTVSSLEEKVIVEPKKKDINLAMKLSQDSEYAPATIHVDGSASIPKTGTITKFMYDFGEGK